MSKLKGGKIPYVDYYMSFHMGFCHGPVDSIEQIYIKEKPILDEGQMSIGSNQAVSINKPELFGGPEREGGVAGTIRTMLGGVKQFAPEALASRLGLRADNDVVVGV